MIETTGVNKVITEELRKRVRKLLEDGRIQCFLGYEAGTLPWLPRPLLVRLPEDAKRLVWNSFLTLNLANYCPGILKELSASKEKGEKNAVLGMVATGCWSRNLVIQAQENQVDRGRIYVIGIASRGMVSRQGLLKIFSGREPHRIVEDDHTLTFYFPDGAKDVVNRWDLVRENCKTCIHPGPVDADEIIGPAPGTRQVDKRFTELEAVEAMGPDARWAWFEHAFKECIRCYACRNACPLCYCPTCFVDDSRPQWVGKSVELSETLIFHVVRAFHCAGRCTDCGACEAVCPKGIPMRILTKRLIKACVDHFGFEPGLIMDEAPLLGHFDQNDPDLSLKT